MNVEQDTSATAPLVTVVVVNHNYGRFLSTSLESVLNQTYSNIECIVIDNVSTDNSKDIIEAYEATFSGSGRTYKAVFSQENLYQTGSSVLGFSHSTGSYVIFLDADDYLLPAGVETHVRAHLMSRHAVGFTAGDMYQTRSRDVVGCTGQDLSRFVMSCKGQKRDFLRADALSGLKLNRDNTPISLGSKDLHYVKRSNRNWVWAPTSALCFRRAALDLMLSDYKPKMPRMTDTYLIRGTSAITGSIVIDRPVAVYRLHGSNSFTTEPSLDNFRGYDASQLAIREPAYIREILASYAANAPQFAARLLWPSVYFDAVRVVAGSSKFVKPQQLWVSSPAMEFLILNRAPLVRSFGQKTYAVELLKSIRGPLDALATLRTVALPAPAASTARPPSPRA